MQTKVVEKTTPKEEKSQQERYTQRVYYHLITLALFAHFCYVCIFGYLGHPRLALYNVCSVLFYCGMYFCVHKGYYRTGITAVHVEVCSFVAFTCLLAGWNTGIGLYLVALGSLVYLCPFDRTYIPYLFSLMEISVFLLLRLVSEYVPPMHILAPRNLLFLSLFNAVASFAVILYAAFVSNVSAKVGRQELQEQNQTLTQLAHYDQLTGLLSRHSMLERLEESKGTPAVMAMGDVDDFKLVNDTYGHACGDYILHTVGMLMGAYCGSQSHICRWGGEEFLLLYPSTPLEEVKRQVQRLCDAVNKHEFLYQGKQLHITITLGICQGNGIDDPMQVMHCADQLMYMGKKQGKNQVVSHSMG